MAKELYDIIERLEGKLDNIYNILQEHETDSTVLKKTIYGNGIKGLAQRTEDLEKIATSINTKIAYASGVIVVVIYILEKIIR